MHQKIEDLSEEAKDRILKKFDEAFINDNKGLTEL